ncbi:CNP1-like family protein [Alysiella filiformis]|uniref:CNP1-like family protein n=1 Tax=Alysiella filiformis DSM 16848 TaxID=1120981 RepID=A0A286EFG0_9NEIS|nr:CNP1-like family protein [Alysiella filiformis]QMT30663.1 hypothetical protein H3L97_07880 [Alysiella filiformis]UBQ56359.1 CNP1-like family protein [Alysiella filiformis DSM 16848]SOD69641.1 CNP1-like family protein [Alysiella filiformis DSM 16848]
MKKQLFVGLMLLAFAHFAQAESRDWNDNFTETRSEFQETEMDLPDLPNPNEGDWLDLYISETHKGTARILLSSVHIAPDRSVRYILNQRSAQGYDNVSAEGILCMTGYRFLDSGGAKVKTFGYGDWHNQRWITPRKSDWAVLGGKMSHTDKVRGTMYQLLCIDGLPKNDDDLRKRLHTHGGRNDRERELSRKNSRDDD